MAKQCAALVDPVLRGIERHIYIQHACGKTLPTVIAQVGPIDDNGVLRDETAAHIAQHLNEGGVGFDGICEWFETRLCKPRRIAEPEN